MMVVISRSPLTLAAQTIPDNVVPVQGQVDVTVVVALHLAPGPGIAGAGLPPDPGPVTANADLTAEMTAGAALADAPGQLHVAAAGHNHTWHADRTSDKLWPSVSRSI